MTYIPAPLRELAARRAAGRCEYCRFPEDAMLLAFEMEHIVAEKHGGKTVAANLALACPYCNRAKGTDLGSIDPETGELTPFFNPRMQEWADHFRLDGANIVPLTPAGRVTAAILQFNHPDRVAERQPLVQAGLYAR
ncbi:MAG: HNH endonuclease [Anaerolineales bacterium]|nr:HNH endonuclease [Anaerolineales bacterium]